MVKYFPEWSLLKEVLVPVVVAARHVKLCHFVVRKIGSDAPGCNWMRCRIMRKGGGHPASGSLHIWAYLSSKAVIAGGTGVVGMSNGLVRQRLDHWHQCLYKKSHIQPKEWFGLVEHWNVADCLVEKDGVLPIYLQMERSIYWDVCHVWSSASVAMVFPIKDSKLSWEQQVTVPV